MDYGPELLWKNPLSTITNEHSRREWATNHVLKPIIFWKNVIFSDETTLELFPKRREYVRRPPKSGLENNTYRKLQNSEEKSSWLGVSLPMMAGKVSPKLQEKSIPVITFKFRKNIFPQTWILVKFSNRIIPLLIMLSEQKFGWLKMR